MDKHLEQYLYKKYPVLFQDNTKSMQETCMCWGLECGNGWFCLIDNLCNQITTYIKNQHETVDWYEKYKEQHKKNGAYRPPSTMEKVSEVKFSQVKEKMGLLTIYHSGGNEIVSNMIGFAESLSGYICEDCGKFDATVGISTKGWIHVICKDCNSKQEYNGWELLDSSVELSKVLSEVKKKTKVEELHEAFEKVAEVRKRSEKQ